MPGTRHRLKELQILKTIEIEDRSHLQAINRAMLKNDRVAIVIQDLIQSLIQRLLVTIKDDLYLEHHKPSSQDFSSRRLVHSVVVHKTLKLWHAGHCILVSED